MTKTKITKGLGLSAIGVLDIKKAKHFFVDILGFELKEDNEEFNWMELEGSEGGRIGVGQACADMKAGVNASLSISVENIEEAKKELEAKGIKFTGDITEVPGHVKLAPFVDDDGNEFFLAQKLN